MKIILIIVFLAAFSASVLSAEIGETAPPFSLKSISGMGSVDLDSQSEKILYIDFGRHGAVPANSLFRA